MHIIYKVDNTFSKFKRIVKQKIKYDIKLSFVDLIKDFRNKILFYLEE